MLKGSSPHKILAIRVDRLGDMLLTTPALQALKRSFPHAKVTVMVQDWVAPVIRGLPFIDEVLTYEPKGRHRGFEGWLRLRREVASGGFDRVVCFQSERRVSLALRFAGISFRVGPLSKPHTFLCFNHGVRQHRSEVAKHEAEYNIDLLEALGADVNYQGLATHVFISDDVKAQARSWLLAQGLGGKSFVVVHPGMGGSALNWPTRSYVELVEKLRKKGLPVLVSGGKSESSLLLEVAGASGAVVYCAEGQAIDYLGGLFAEASVVVAPSTGPLHLAVALGRSVVSFYPPVRVQSAKRWGPWRPLQGQVFTPPIPPEVCGDPLKCRKESCGSFSCMGKISVDDVYQAVLKAQSGQK